MADLSLRGYITYFESLDLKEKVRVLSELTSILNKDVMTANLPIEPEDNVVDELFRAWADE